MKIKDHELNAVFDAVKDTMEEFCNEAGLDTDMRVYTSKNGMYSIKAGKLLRGLTECKGINENITLITGTDPEGREYPVTIPMEDIKLILDKNNLVAYETDDDYIARAKLRSNDPGNKDIATTYPEKYEGNDVPSYQITFNELPKHDGEPIYVVFNDEKIRDRWGILDWTKKCIMFTGSFLNITRDARCTYYTRIP